jgi:hypothetical protein
VEDTVTMVVVVVVLVVEIGRRDVVDAAVVETVGEEGGYLGLLPLLLLQMLLLDGRRR